MLAGVSTFTGGESACLNRGRCAGLLGRLAAADPDGAPHVTPLGVSHDPGRALVTGGPVGTNMAASKKFMPDQTEPKGGGP
jgi:hypothetical protein